MEKQGRLVLERDFPGPDVDRDYLAILAQTVRPVLAEAPVHPALEVFPGLLALLCRNQIEDILPHQILNPFQTVHPDRLPVCIEHDPVVAFDENGIRTFLKQAPVNRIFWRLRGWGGGCHITFTTYDPTRMIAFAKRLLRPKPLIRYSRPSLFVLYRGARDERIDAEFDPVTKRMTKLIVHTRQT